MRPDAQPAPPALRETPQLSGLGGPSSSFLLFSFPDVHLLCESRPLSLPVGPEGLAHEHCTSQQTRVIRSIGPGALQSRTRFPGEELSWQGQCIPVEWWTLKSLGQRTHFSCLVPVRSPVGARAPRWPVGSPAWALSTATGRRHRQHCAYSRLTIRSQSRPQPPQLWEPPAVLRSHTDASRPPGVVGLPSQQLPYHLICQGASLPLAGPWQAGQDGSPPTACGVVVGSKHGGPGGRLRWQAGDALRESGDTREAVGPRDGGATKKRRWVEKP